MDRFSQKDQKRIVDALEAGINLQSCEFHAYEGIAKK